MHEHLAWASRLLQDFKNFALTNPIVLTMGYGKVPGNITQDGSADNNILYDPPNLSAFSKTMLNNFSLSLQETDVSPTLM